MEKITIEEIKDLCLEKLYIIYVKEYPEDVKKIVSKIKDIIHLLIISVDKNSGLNPERYINKIKELEENNENDKTVKDEICEDLDKVFKSPEYKKLIDIENSKMFKNIKSLTPEELKKVNKKKKICLKKLEVILDKYFYEKEDDDDENYEFNDKKEIKCEDFMLNMEKIKTNFSKFINLVNSNIIINHFKSQKFYNSDFIKDLESLFNSEEYKDLMEIEKKTWMYQLKELLKLLKIVIKEMKNKENLDKLVTYIDLLKCFLKCNLTEDKNKICFKTILICFRKILKNKDCFDSKNYKKLIEKIEELELSILNIDNNINLDDFYIN